MTTRQVMISRKTVHCFRPKCNNKHRHTIMNAQVFSNILWPGCFIDLFVKVVLIFPSHWIQTSLYSLLVFIWESYLFNFLSCVFVFACFRPVCCFPNVASVSGLSILDCPFIYKMVKQTMNSSFGRFRCFCVIIWTAIQPILITKQYS